jgi:aldehyde dehydrogenase (NAD+)
MIIETLKRLKENNLLSQRPLSDKVYPSVYSDCDIKAKDILGLEGLKSLTVGSPVDNKTLGYISMADPSQVDKQVALAHEAFLKWRLIPAPKRGELVRLLAESFRENKEVLASLITLECGKILQESLGEVQEAIDVCDFAVGLSRQLHGLTIASERPEHRMMEQWHPLGAAGIITAFNFPMAVWAWNATLALVCGNSLVWKPSEKTALCALACQELFNEAAGKMDGLPSPLSSVVIGDRNIGRQLAEHRLLPLVSATGSVPMGRKVAQTVAARLGRSLLELGGNNAMIVTPSADLELAVRAILFSAVGTCGQRCTTLRRLIVHEDIEPELNKRLVKAYQTVSIGDPLDPDMLVGPLIDERAFEQMMDGLELAGQQGGDLLFGGERVKQQVPEGGYYVQPAIIKMPAHAAILQEETFAPILYVITYSELDEAIDIHNKVPQGLSSAIFSNDMREVEIFMSARGSDCGIANANIGTSGAEIGGAFGGEKDTGGGRESGSDAWKNYMRRATNTVNYGSGLPLAQGIKFD